MNNLFEMSGVAVACIPIVVGLVGVANTLGLSKKYSSLLSILLGVALLALTGITWQSFLAQGIIIGLSASGLYSGGKKLLE